jgi:hypothetical protein
VKDLLRACLEGLVVAVTVSIAVFLFVTAVGLAMKVVS